MDKQIINKTETESEKINVSDDKTFKMNHVIMGIIYINYKTFFEDKWRKRFFC